MAERNIVRQPLTAAEIRALGRRAGGVAELVAPQRRSQTEGMTDAEIVAWLAADPSRLRRPIIDTGAAVLLGFTAAVRDALS